jgi:hypothetical protein
MNISNRHLLLSLKIVCLYQYKMERFKQTIAKLETDIAELKQFQTKIQGSKQSKGDIHYSAGTQEFGEYALEEIDTFRFLVTPRPPKYNGIHSSKTYKYTLINITPAIGNFTTEFIAVDIENFEKFIMKSGNLTEEKRKCLQCKLWDFAADVSYEGRHQNGNLTIDTAPELYKDLPQEFYADITVPFTHTYKISPHVSFYITPLLNTLDECVIHEITTKQVVFRIKYGNIKKDAHLNPIKQHIYSGLKLHYSISGVIEQNDNLLD